MKHLFIILLIVFAVVFTSCGKKDEVKQEKKDVVKKEEVKDDILKGLFYQQDPIKSSYENIGEGRLSTKDEKVKCAYILNLYFKGDWKNYKNEEFKSATEKIGKYPAIISKTESAIDIYVQVSPGVLAIVTWRNDFLPGYDNLESMKKIASMFDFEGIEKLTGDKVNVGELGKYFPKFEVQK